jgi:hypothetical protein
MRLEQDAQVIAVLDEVVLGVLRGEFDLVDWKFSLFDRQRNHKFRLALRTTAAKTPMNQAGPTMQVDISMHTFGSYGRQANFIP